MHRIRRFLPSILLVLTVVAVGLLALRAREHEPISSTLAVGKPIPEMQLQTLDNGSVKLSDQRGKVVVIDFWATWCPPCVLSLPHLQEIASDPSLADRGLVVWAVNAQEPRHVVRAFVDESKYTFTVPLDPGPASMTMGIIGLPTTIVVGRDGNVSHLMSGFDRRKSPKELRDAIETALAK